MKEALMSAYFEKGIDLSKKENLAALAARVDLDKIKTEKFLNSDDLSDEVKKEEQLNYQRGISSVPYFIINNKYGLSGAQPTEVFVQALREIATEVMNGFSESDEVGERC